MASKPSETTKTSVRDRSAPLSVYVDPAAAKALRIYAATHDAKVHDLLIEAVENWFRSHDLKEPVRVT